MSYTETNWDRYFSEQRPVKVAVSKVEPKEAAAFIRGCREIYNLTVDIDPDVIFFPERGAGPITWTLDVFGDFDGRKLPKVSLLLGTHIEVETGKEGGITKGEKRLVIEDGLRRASELYGSIRKPLLIDEAQSGATLRTAAHFLYSHLRNQGITELLYVIAAQDTRNGWLTHKKAHGFSTIVSNNRPHIKADVVEMPLFSTDRQVFLNHISYSLNEEPARRPMRQKLIYNLEAIQFISSLASALVKPQDFDEAIFFAEDEENTVGTKSDLSHWMRSVLSSYDGDNSQVSREKILNWFIDYKKCLQG